jgi:tyrosinase
MSEMSSEIHAAMRHRRMHSQDMSMDRPMDSFVDMILMLDPEIFRRLKWPPHWFLMTYPRKNQAELTELEQQRFLCAYQTLLGNGTLGQLVKIHSEVHYQHGSQRFLPWHRIYLIMLEHALQSVHPDVAIPYWDWTNPAEQAVPAWLAGVTPTVPMPAPTAPITVTRSSGSAADLAALASNIPAIQGIADFATYTSSLEGVHGGVHVWVGGTMSMIPTAPADPIFWMHHCNLDRLWWQWQQSYPGVNPTLTGSGASSAVMDPWSYTETQTRDITALGYDYV